MAHFLANGFMRPALKGTLLVSMWCDHGGGNFCLPPPFGWKSEGQSWPRKRRRVFLWRQQSPPLLLFKWVALELTF